MSCLGPQNQYDCFWAKRKRKVKIWNIKKKNTFVLNSFWRNWSSPFHKLLYLFAFFDRRNTLWSRTSANFLELEILMIKFKFKIKTMFLRLQRCLWRGIKYQPFEEKSQLFPNYLVIVIFYVHWHSNSFLIFFGLSCD